jgi:2-succinyl-5-enolpyruvyl-6-hydroxy-3-cyclohexene-1-carboxylate synthase
VTPAANVQATFCATLVDEWVRGGVTHAVVSPGSRSTPLALALADDGRVRLHVHHDERAAAFLALGIGVASGVPAVVLTTSGTAAVELHPAVVEASQAGVPMLVCTADRPPELQSVGAPQTVDQAHLFGRAPRWFADPGVADEAAAGTWRSLAARALAEATGAWPGPVHLNLPFREPLVGTAGPLPEGRVAAWHTASHPEAFERFELPPGRGVLVAGGGVRRPDAVLALADRLGWPVLADPRSGCRVPGQVAAFDALLRVPGFAEEHRPDVVVRLGSPPASKVLAAWSGAHEIAVAPTWIDPDHRAATVVLGDPSAWCDAVVGEQAPDGWASSWRDADAAAQRAIDDALAAHAAVTEPFVARTVAAAATQLVVASSMPVRDVEWYAPPGTGCTAFANRGANGIDGVVSTAVGVALGSGRPVTALVGDVAFLHDANALLGLADRGVDVTVVVVDNRGGGIFSFLPQATALPPERFELLFGTPHDVDLAALAGAHGLPVTTVTAPADLRGALAGSGPRVVLVPTDRAANVAVHEAVHAAVAASV